MKFKLWLENVLYEDDDILIRDAEPNEIPQFYIHRTEDQSDIDGIVAHGFDMRKFGRTARRFNIPAWMHQHDPRGIFSTTSDNEPETDYQQYDKRPYVIFTANIQKALVVIEKSRTVNSKEALSRFMGGKTKGHLTRALLKMGYQAVLRQGSEQIILDPRLIQIVRSSRG
jgi:hypothetical protein